MNSPPPAITLTTDYGTLDGYTGALKGAILSILPDATLIDITQHIPRHDVLAGAVSLLTACKTFPPGSIHVLVVDPEVGSERKGLLVKAWDQWFVAPDSGVLHFALKYSDAQVFELLAPKRSKKTTTFDGRDWFAPTAAKLAGGEPVSTLATPTDDYALLNIPDPTFNEYRWEGCVLHTDHFGNLISNLPAPPEHIAATARVFVGDHAVGPIRKGYYEVERNKPAATIGNLQTVEVGLNQGNAQQHYQVRRGQKVEVLFPEIIPEPDYPAWQ